MLTKDSLFLLALEVCGATYLLLLDLSDDLLSLLGFGLDEYFKLEIDSLIFEALDFESPEDLLSAFFRRSGLLLIEFVISSASMVSASIILAPFSAIISSTLTKFVFS